MKTRTVRAIASIAFASVLVGLAIVGRFGNDEPVTPLIVTPAAEQAEPQQNPLPASDPQPVAEASVLVAETAEPPAMPEVFARTEMGARAAAIRYLEATEEIVQMTPEAASQSQRSISTAASADRLSVEVHEQMVGLVAQAPQGINLWLAPMEARSTETENGFEVSIWYAEVVAIGTAATVDNWRTVTYTLVWERDTWLIDDRGSVEGPVPARSGGLVVTPPGTLVSILDGYDDNGLTP